MAQLIPNGKKITESKKALFPKKALEDMHKREVATGKKRSTSDGFMPSRAIPDVTKREENKVLKSVAKTGHYEMSDKRKQKLSDAWEKAKPGTGFKVKQRTAQ